jgi:hypothetical protein
MPPLIGFVLNRNDPGSRRVNWESANSPDSRGLMQLFQVYRKRTFASILSSLQFLQTFTGEREVSFDAWHLNHNDWLSFATKIPSLPWPASH